MASEVLVYEVVPAGLAAGPSFDSLADSSLHLPAGAYTTFRTHGGRRIVRLDHHLRRLEDSLASRALAPAAAPSLDRARVRAAIAQALRETGHPESRLRVTWAPPRLFVAVEPFRPLPEQLYRDGIRCVTVEERRERPHAKDTRFVQAADRAYRRLPAGVHEGLLVGEDGAVLEGLSSNFFAVLEGALRTEEDRALPGVTRSLVLDAAAGVLPVHREAVRLPELARVTECFITSASRGILPVVGVDGKEIASGRPGPLTRELSRRYEKLVEREAEEP